MGQSAGPQEKARVRARPREEKTVARRGLKVLVDLGMSRAAGVDKETEMR